MLLENGTDVNGVDEIYRTTRLLCAAWKGHGDVTKVLFENSADVNAVNGGTSIRS